MNIRSKLIVTLITTLLLFVTGTSKLQAQQDAEYSMYMFNGLYLNPAYAGSKEAPTLMAIYRHQWSGLEGAPRSFNISGHSPFKRDQYALGGTLHYDQLGAERKYKFDLDFAFRIKVKNDDNKISFGIRAGVLYYTLKPENYQPEWGLGSDVVLDQQYKSIVPNFGFGIHAQGKRYYVSVGLPHLVNLSIKKNASLELLDEAKQFKHLFATAGVVLGKEYGKVKVKPSILYKWSQNAPMDFDINLSLLFIDRIWVGASWRTGGDYAGRRGESIIGILKFKATQNLEIGYAYDHTLSQGLSPFNNGSHEVMLGLEFGNKAKQYVTPRYIRYF